VALSRAHDLAWWGIGGAGDLSHTSAPCSEVLAPWAVVWVRDLGPAENEAARRAFPQRTPWVWIGESSELTPYSDGVDRLWGTLRTGVR
jgi:hypothetical protein